MASRPRSLFWAHNIYMKRYFEHMQTQEPHDRRQHAMRIAGATTVAVFAIWITTLGFRYGTGSSTLAEDENQTSLTAATSQSIYGGQNQLIVSTTTGN